MKSIRNLWWLGVVAAVMACDPYDDENKGQPEVLSVFAANGETVFAATGDAETGFKITSTSTCSPAELATAQEEAVPEHTDADAPAIFVKFNKLLDGASIQTNPDSCIPAGDWLTATTTSADADPETDWFTCYNPSTPTDSEGSSIVIYPGANVSTGPAGDGWLATYGLAASKTAPIVYVLGGSIKDGEGNVIPLNIEFTVDPDAGPVDPAVTAATGGTTLTWDAAACGTATGYNVYKQDPADDAPVLLTAAPITAPGASPISYTDSTPVAEREYFIAPMIGTIETKPQGPFTLPAAAP